MWALSAVAGLLLVQPAPAQRYVPPPADAPSVAEAAAFARRTAEEGHIWQGNSMADATRSTTPEAIHRTTGARCRFWYGSGEITYPFYGNDHVVCITRRNLVSVETRIDRREVPAAVAGNPEHIWAYLAAPGSARDVVAALAAREARNLGGMFEVSELRRWTGTGGKTVDYAVAHIRYPGGAPNGTPQERINRVALAVIGDWIFLLSADGPVHYAASLEPIGEDGFARLLQSIEEAGLIL